MPKDIIQKISKTTEEINNILAKNPKPISVLPEIMTKQPTQAEIEEAEKIKKFNNYN